MDTMSKYRRNLSQYEAFVFTKRNDRPEAMNEFGRNEDYPSNTAWRNPMPSTDSLPKIKARGRQVHLGDRAYVKMCKQHPQPWETRG